MPRILLQCSTPYRADDWHIGRFSLLVRELERWAEVTARDHGGDDDSVLVNLSRSQFDEIWILAVDSGIALTGIWHRGWIEAHASTVPSALVEARTAVSFERRAATCIARTVVAVVGDSVAGFVTVKDDEVEQLYVGSAHRGSMVARLLLEAGERMVAEAGYVEAWLAVVPSNARARRFYERNGWVDAGAFEYPALTEEGPIATPCLRYVKRG